MDHVLWLPVKGHCYKVEILPYHSLLHGNDVKVIEKEYDPSHGNIMKVNSTNEELESPNESNHPCRACFYDKVISSFSCRDPFIKGRMFNIIIRRPKFYLIQILVACLRQHSFLKQTMCTILHTRLTCRIPCFHVVSFLKLLHSFLLGRIYVDGDKIFLRSSRKYTIALKFMQVLENYESRQKTRDVLLDVAVACYLVALKHINVIEGLKETTTSITSTAFANTATFGIEQAAQIVGNTAASAAVSAIVDVAISSAMLYMAKRQRDEGVISDKEFTTKIKKTVFKSSIKIVAGATGSIIGQAVIPVPVLGGLVGGFCGSLIGSGLAKGINYGLFERNEKKVEIPKQNDEYGVKVKLHNRKLRGHVSKITIYNDNTKQFEEKSFEKELKKYFKHEVMKQDLSIMCSLEKDANSPLNRRKLTTVAKAKGKDDIDDLNVTENIDFLTRWKVMKQSMTATPKKKSLTAINIYQENEILLENVGNPKLQDIELAEERYVDESAVLIANKKESATVMSEEDNPKENSNSQVSDSHHKSISLTNIRLHNLREVFSGVKYKQEELKPSDEKINHTKKDICEENVSTDSITDECTGDDKTSEVGNYIKIKRNFIENLIQQIKHSNSFKMNKSAADCTKKAIDEETITNDGFPETVGNDESNLQVHPHTNIKLELTSGCEDKNLSESEGELYQEDDMESNEVEVKESDGVNKEEFKSAENMASNNWKLLIELFKKEKELQTAAFVKLKSEPMFLPQMNIRNKIAEKVVENVAEKTREPGIHIDSSKSESLTIGTSEIVMSPHNELNNLEDNVLNYCREAQDSYRQDEPLIFQGDDKTGIDKNDIFRDNNESITVPSRTNGRKTSFFNYCHNVYGQLEKKMSGNLVNSNPSANNKKINENNIDQSEMSEVETKKKSYFERMKNMSKKCLPEHGNK